MQKILIVHTGGGLGDLLLSTPVIEALAYNFPQAKIDFLAKRSTSPAIKNHPLLNKIITLDNSEPTWKEIFTLSQKLRQENYDASLVLWSKTKIAFMLLLARIPVRVGQDSRLSYSWTYTHKVKIRSEHNDTQTPWGEILLDYVRALNLPIPAYTYKFIIPPEAQERATKLLQRLPDLPGPIIGLHPSKGISNPDQRWPVDVFAQYAKILVEKLQARLIITGGPQEEKMIAKLIELNDLPCLNLAGQTDVDTLAAVAKKCQVFICPDSGPMHLASICGTPVIGIYALKEDFPRRWAPVGKSSLSIIPCPNTCSRHCLKAQCPDFQCYQQITPQQILQAVEDILAITLDKKQD